MMGIADLNDYSQTVNGMSQLKAIADDLNIAVIVIHHNRKGGDMDGDHMDSALGSTGINATADTTLTMRRKRGTSEAVLSVTGRDVEDTAYTMTWDKDICSWAVTGSGSLKPVLSEAQQQIADLLESEARNWTTGEIAEATEKSKAATGNLLKRLREAGRVESLIYGQWRTKSSFTLSPSLRRCETVKLPDTGTTDPEAPCRAVPAEEELPIW
jgi:DNA-binding transcriptional ArsR family regulator